MNKWLLISLLPLHTSLYELLLSKTDLWEAGIRFCVFVKDAAAVGSWIQQGGVVVSGRTADAPWPHSLKQHINILHSWTEDVARWEYNCV